MLHVFRLTTTFFVVSATSLKSSSLVSTTAWRHALLRGGSGAALKLDEPDDVEPELVLEELLDQPDELPPLPSGSWPEEQADLPEELVDQPNEPPPLPLGSWPEEQAALPEESPSQALLASNRSITVFQNSRSDAFPLGLGDCCIVGSSDILNGAGRGPEIDSHETVIRVNRLPTYEFYTDFGRRTDVAALNRLLSRKGLLEFFGGEYLDCIEQIGGAGEDVVAGASCDFRAVVLKEVNESTASPWLRAPFPVGVQDQSIREVAYEMLNQDAIPSTGFTTFLAMVPLCDKLTLYGFGPGKGTADGHIFKTEEEVTRRSAVEDSLLANFHDLEAEHKILDLISLGMVPVLPSTSTSETYLDFMETDRVESSSRLWLREQLGAMRGRIKIVGGS